MGASKAFGAGVALLLLAGLAGCTTADPVQVSSIAATVKKLDLKSMGGVACEGIYNAPPGGTVSYERTIAIRGAGQVMDLVARLERAGYTLNVRDTQYSKQYTYLNGPHETDVILSTKEGTIPGDKFHLDDAHMCTLPKAGLTILAFGTTNG